jgi:hypothetical protein
MLVIQYMNDQIKDKWGMDPMPFPIGSGQEIVKIFPGKLEA